MHVTSTCLQAYNFEKRFTLPCYYHCLHVCVCVCPTSCLSSQLFGEPDADEDVSPDTEATGGGLGEQGEEGEGEEVPMMNDGFTEGVTGRYSRITAGCTFILSCSMT